MQASAIKDALKAKGMTQKELADALACSKALVNHLISGAVRPTYQRAMALERVLGIPHQELLSPADGQRVPSNA